MDLGKPSRAWKSLMDNQARMYHVIGIMIPGTKEKWDGEKLDRKWKSNFETTERQTKERNNAVWKLTAIYNLSYIVQKIVAGTPL